MPFFSEEWIADLLARADIIDVVSGYVTMQQKGGKWWGCCPFHNEKTPSFTVDEGRGFYHCFGCKESGNVIHFIMKNEKLTFPESCIMLAEKYNVPIPENSEDTDYDKRKKQKEKVLILNKLAAKFFYANLQENHTAMQYLVNRGVELKTVKAFGIGFAKDSWDDLQKYLQKEGYTNYEMQMAGLVKLKEDKAYDVFRNRVIIPIIDTFSNVIAFGGRVLDDSLPKYLNSAETPAYNKRKNLYNLNLVRKIKNLQSVILVEGYMDVIALYSHEIYECVATLGTALTSEQARLLKRYVSNVYIAYDGDSAGKKATMRAIDILEKEELVVRVISIPDNLDPDDFLKKYKKEGFLSLMKQAKPALDYKFATVASKYDLTSQFDQEKFIKECVQIIREVQSAVTREKYINKLAKFTGFSKDAITNDVYGNTQVREIKYVKQEKKEKLFMPERIVMYYILQDPQNILKIADSITKEDFEENANKFAFEYILDNVNKGVCPTDAEILTVTNSKQDIEYLTELLCSDIELMGEDKKVDDYILGCIKKIHIKNKEQELKRLTSLLKSDAGAAKQISDLTKEIYNLKTNL